mgnify:CR=1 FL=1
MNILKRRHNWLALPALLVIVFCFFSGFSSDVKPVSVSEKLIERTEIMQQCLEGTITYGEAEKQLSRIETQPLLAEDTKNLKNSVDTDFDTVHMMHIVSTEEKRDILGSRTYEIAVKWDMEGPDGRYVTEGTYNVVTQKTGQKYLLSKFDLI